MKRDPKTRQLPPKKRNERAIRADRERKMGPKCKARGYHRVMDRSVRVGMRRVCRDCFGLFWYDHQWRLQ